MITINQVKELLAKYGTIVFDDDRDDVFKIKAKTGRIEIYVSRTEYNTYISIEKQLAGRKTITISDLIENQDIKSIDKWIKTNFKRCREA